MVWTVWKRGWTWKELWEVCFVLKKKKKIRGLKVKDVLCHMTLDQQETGCSTGRPEPISRCVSARSSHVRNIWLSSRRLAWQMMKNQRSESKESGQNHPSIAEARSLIMNKRCQNWRIGIPESSWHQMGAATCRPSLQHLTEWLMGAAEAWLSLNAKHKQH